MRAALYREFGATIRVESVPDPSLPDDGVIIEVRANGICRSDWHGWMGHDPDVSLPHVPGHELAGIVVAVGKFVQNFAVGDRVTTPFSCGCGVCAQCVTGQQHICDHYFQPGFTAWGSFAQQVAIPCADVNLVRLPDAVDFVTAASLGCRFITSFRAVAVQGQVKGGEWVAVFGCGGVGLSAVMIAAAFGARVIAVDINDEALHLAEKVGAVASIKTKSGSCTVEQVAELSDGGVHLSLDALGSNETCRSSILSLRKQGRHVQVGVMAGDHAETAIPMGTVMGRELRLIGSHGMQAHAYPSIFAMLEHGTLDPKKLISTTVSLEEGAQVLMKMNDFQHAGVMVIDTF